jgi:hypothetical protein
MPFPALIAANIATPIIHNPDSLSFFLQNFFDTIFFRVVFLNAHGKKTPENAIQQTEVEEKLTCFFSGNVFDMHGLFANKNCGVFELISPYRETPKAVLKKVSKKEAGGYSTFS